MIQRRATILKSNSFFLFGARGTGKTTLLNTLFDPSEALRIDLLDPGTYAQLQANPSLLLPLVERAKLDGKTVIIDEVQKVPTLLDFVHLMIERDKVIFGLTGSSARKLRRGAANLLAGRAFVYKLFPLLADELGQKFNLEDAVSWGTLPSIWNTSDNLSRSLYLQAYAETYLREEIVVEQIIRNLPPFRRFLQVAAQMSGKLINYAKVASDCLTDPSNVRNYFQILDDTLLGFFLEPFHESIRKRQTKSAKFYFIDTGISRALSGLLDVPVRRGTYHFGDLFESFVITQIRTTLEYSLSQYQLSYLRTKDDAELDLIIERGGRPRILVEIKSSATIRPEELSTLKRFASDMKGSVALCLYNGEMELQVDSVRCLPWRLGIDAIMEIA
jgi:predicted AAA+ superfamily ATPase